MAATEKIVITGSPGTGKTALIKALNARGFTCLPEVSREITLEARAQGIEQLFLEDALLFSRKLLDRRTEQFHEADRASGMQVFLDRGIPDVPAYMEFAGASYPDSFREACEKHRYHRVFLLPPWEEIYTSDSERYEDFRQATEIHSYIANTYSEYGYQFTEVPTGAVELRADFIINAIS